MFTNDGHVWLLLLDIGLAEITAIPLCGKASFTPTFYYSFTTTALNCLLFQGNSCTPRKTQYFHQVTELFLDIGMALDSHNFMELLVASPNMTSLNERIISARVNDLLEREALGMSSDLYLNKVL